MAAALVTIPVGEEVACNAIQPCGGYLCLHIGRYAALRDKNAGCQVFSILNIANAIVDVAVNAVDITLI